MIDHGVTYPPEFLKISEEILLERSQTNVTADAGLGLKYAVAAYDKGLWPHVKAGDRTYAGQAAAKAGFRSQQLSRPLDVVNGWFEESTALLSGDDEKSRRERIATNLLWVRSLALREVTTERSSDEATAKAKIHQVENQVDEQHIDGQLWDRYGTMAYKHFATYEAIRKNGTTVEASSLALRGLHLAICASPEIVPEDKRPEKLKKLVKHAKFVVKQVLGNAMALGLAVSRPLDKLPSVHKRRRHLAYKILS